MYVVTFRIADRTVGGKNYQQRYDDLIERLSANSDGFWYDTTSFYLIGSSEDTYSFANRVVNGLSSQYDMLFVFDPEDMSAAYFGSVKHVEALTSFFSRAKKIG